MASLIRCPDCQKLLKDEKDLAGKKVKCPNCGLTIDVAVNLVEVIEKAVEESASEEAIAPAVSAHSRALPLPEVIADEEVGIPSPSSTGNPEKGKPDRGRLTTGVELYESPIKPIRFPGAMRGAGIIWILFCLLVLLGSIALLGLVLLAAIIEFGRRSDATKSGQTRNVYTEEKADAVVAISVCSLSLAILFGAIFLTVGIQSVAGKAVGTLGSAFSSIFFAAIYGLWGIVLVTGRFGTKAITVRSLVEGVLAILGCLLLLIAGLLALGARHQYAAWRKAMKAARQQIKR